MSDRMQIWAILMVISMAFSGSAAAQVGGASLENPGLTPDSPFYFLDGIGESVQLAITLDPEAKIDLELEFAEEKVAEARAMAKEGNFDAMAVAEDRHGAVLTRVETKIENLIGRKVSFYLSSNFLLYPGSIVLPYHPTVSVLLMYFYVVFHSPSLVVFYL